MKRLLKLTIVFLVVMVVAIVAVTLYLLRDRSLSRLQQKGIIRIGYAVEAPYAFLKENGEVTGESPEVAKWIVARLGIRSINWWQSELGLLVSELESGHFEVIAAGMFITLKRSQHVSFSEPTFHVRQGMLVAKGNPRQIHSYQQAVKETDYKIAVIKDAVEEALLLRLGALEHQLVLVPDALPGRVAVESGIADGLALSSPAIQWMALHEQLGKTEMATPFEQSELALKERFGFGAFAFRKNDRQLLSAWNEVQKSFIGSAEHQKSVSEFGFSSVELPGAVTTEEVLSQP